MVTTLVNLLIDLARKGYDVSFIGNFGFDSTIDDDSIIVTIRYWVAQEENFLNAQAIIGPHLLDESYITREDMLVDSINRLKDSLDKEIEELDNDE